MKTDLAQFRARNLEWLFENETGYQRFHFGHRYVGDKNVKLKCDVHSLPSEDTDITMLLLKTIKFLDELYFKISPTM